jgi:hypothetical protein
MTRWEYHLITLFIDAQKGQDGRHETPRERDKRIEETLSALGEDRWELVSFVPVALHTSPANPWAYHAIFKRAKKD